MIATQQLHLLIGDQFFQDMEAKIAAAQNHIDVMFMTFEGDNAGWHLANQLIAKAHAGLPIRVLIDHFTTFWVSDKTALNPTTWPEWQATRQMITAMRQAGIAVKMTNPAGFMLRRFFRRNHRKIVLIDECGYMGGINISDHNYGWHDLMVRMEGSIATTLKQYFDEIWYGQPVCAQQGFFTEKNFAHHFQQIITDAQHEIILSSPYFWDLKSVPLLTKAAHNGVKVTILTPQTNNRQFLKFIIPYLRQTLLNAGVEILQYPYFSHAKYMIVDQKTAVFGSSNFSYEGYMSNQEICYQTDDPALVQAFITNLYQPDKHSTIPLTAANHHYSPWFLSFSHFANHIYTTAVNMNHAL